MSEQQRRAVPNPAKRPTIRDVAAVAGVSKSLVSLVYSDPEKVSEARKSRVLAAADELGFRPNLLARSLATNMSDFIGILVADPINPVFAEIIDAASLEFDRAGRRGLMTTAVLPESGTVRQLDEGTIATLSDLRPRSVLIAGSLPDAASLGALAEDRPVVVASGLAEGLPNAGCVRTDDRKGLALLVEHLTSLGHRDIAHLGGLAAAGRSRAEAYEEAMTAHGLAGHVQVQESDFTELGGYVAATSLLSRATPPTAIIAPNDLAALGVQRALEERGLTTDDVALTGYDNSFLASIAGVSLTSVDPHNGVIGREAARWLIEAEAGNESLPQELLVEPRLVVRRSSGKGV
ncbi:LacI family transcriptional regulator [Pseudoclavibacter sp. RFBJ3]|nr:LacI family transcriptional regulator [Pseudoclavibacter sp. RFBJ5]PPF93950.1 LacI family transcriptional regulator [Pseudoclavibacter sp. RFBJ3]PPF98667.1 LacI family transcriptional regulator [Pseudoclavibacter sp. RFBH5]PPG24372.1 LacI family transcriptional regulator [Pseudoclavibacter sp. RFBI4]